MHDIRTGAISTDLPEFEEAEKSAKETIDHLINNNGPSLLNNDEPMQNVALSIQNYLKAGNLINASINLKEF